MKLKLPLLIVSIVAVIWVIFFYTHKAEPIASITQPSSATSPIENNHWLSPTASTINPATVESTANEISNSGKLEQRIASTETSVLSIEETEFGSVNVIWKDPARNILQELKHPDPGNRITAIQRLHVLDQTDAIRILKEVLAHDADAYVRGEAVRELVSIGGKEALAAMTYALGDTDTTVRYQVVLALSAAGSEAIHLLGQVLFGDPDPELRRQAVEAIAIQYSPAAQALLAVAAKDPDESVRQQAQLWILEPEWETSPAGDHDSTLGSVAGFAPDDQFLEQLRYLDPEDRIAAIQHLYGLDQNDAVRILSKVLTTVEDAHIRREAVMALASIGGEEAFFAIEEALSDEDTAVRYQAIQALGNSGSKSIHVLGQVLFSEQDPKLRRHAVELIASQDGPATQALLAVAAQDKDESVRLVASQFSHQ